MLTEGKYRSQKIGWLLGIPRHAGTPVESTININLTAPFHKYQYMKFI
jgi:hypothetical protein